MSISQMTSAPWHKERVHRSEGDERRYKGRCEFYDYEKKTCRKYVSACRGSAHCDFYKAISDEEFEQRQKGGRKSAGKKSKEDDVFWY